MWDCVETYKIKIINVIIRDKQTTIKLNSDQH